MGTIGITVVANAHNEAQKAIHWKTRNRSIVELENFMKTACM